LGKTRSKNEIKILFVYHYWQKSRALVFAKKLDEKPDVKGRHDDN
jgi:hypothetical protein